MCKSKRERDREAKNAFINLIRNQLSQFTKLSQRSIVPLTSVVRVHPMRASTASEQGEGQGEPLRRLLARPRLGVEPHRGQAHTLQTGASPSQIISQAKLILGLERKAHFSTPSESTAQVKQKHKSRG